jgi:hypothetical protein
MAMRLTGVAEAEEEEQDSERRGERVIPGVVCEVVG